jgi:hypothetical protein
MWHKLIMGGINFGWLAEWVPSPDWLRRKSDFCLRLRWSRRGWGGECEPCPDLTSYTLAFALQLGKITKNLSQGSRKVLGWSAPNTIRLVDLPIASDGLDWPLSSCRPWLTSKATGSSLGQCRFLPISCTTNVRIFDNSSSWMDAVSRWW